MPTPRRLALALVSLLLLSSSAWLAPERHAEKETPRGPLSPEQALARFRLDEGLRIELVASEPQIESPVAMAFDEAGKLWVVEMLDYPNGPPKGKPGQGRIKILEDLDGDGRYEKATLFAEELLFANGILPWRGGVVVTAAPHILYLKDTNGDGKADVREVLYEGFAAENPQLRVSYPILGLDGWVYVVNGLRGGKVRKAGVKDAKIVDISGMDFRFNLLTGEYEAISGLGQFGNTFDEWGNRFVCDNRHHLRHVVLENRYLKRNPLLAVPQVVEDVSELGDGPLSSGGKIYPLSKNWTTSNLHAGRFTAACGVFIYKGGALPQKYQGNAFTCDPTGNLVHCEVLEPRGATFRSRPHRKGVEFLATPDDWFRPVFLTDGPDGALYVVDMYRAVIEHPEYMPPELRTRPDLLLGRERGRIWRIVPEKQKTKALRPNLSKVKTAELDEHFFGESWERLTAHRLFLERADRAALNVLTKWGFLTSDRIYRSHLVCLVAGLNATDERSVTLALIDERDNRVFEHAVRLAEPWLGKSERIRKEVLALIRKGDERLRFQVALSLGEWDDDRILDPLVDIALKDSEDKWTRIAVASSVPQRAGKLIVTLLTRKNGLTAEATPGRLALLRELAALVGARRDQVEVAQVVVALQSLPKSSDERWRLTALEGLAEGLGRRGGHLGEFLKTMPATLQPEARMATQLLADAARLAGEKKRDLPERLSAIRLLAHTPWDGTRTVLAGLLEDDATQEVRLAAVRALAAHGRPEVPAILLKQWRSHTPGLKREMTEALMRQPDWIQALLAEVEAGRVRPGDIDVLRARQLINHPRPEIREKARKLLQASLPADRREVLARYQEVLKRKGDPKRGQEVFKKNCATCHRVAGLGVDVGPDISDTRTKTPEALLLDILNPNAAIDSNYVNYVVTLKNGKQLSGAIASETSGSITLRRAENQTDVVLRQDVEEVASMGVSLMPEGLEKNIGIDDMSDLVSFLKNWRYLDPGAPPLGRQ